MNEDDEHTEKMLHLEVLKTLRPKLSQLECIKAKILCEVETYSKEQSTSEESEKEIEILRLEKKLHEQAIVDLDKDIRQLIMSVEQSKVEQAVIQSRTKELLDEFNPMKREVDEIRVTIGLDVLPKITETDALFEKKRKP